MGGILADPISNYPSTFGPGSWLGGADGVSWMVKWPFALPNLVTAGFILCSAIAISLGLEEVPLPPFFFLRRNILILTYTDTRNSTVTEGFGSTYW